MASTPVPIRDCPEPSPDLPADEQRRLSALHRLELLDTEPEQEFDALVALAAGLLGCRTALINLVDRDRAWIKASSAPVSAAAIPRTTAFCDLTVRSGALTVIDDLAADLRFARNPLVLDAGLRFYAGTPIHAPDEEETGVRHAIGTLCVLDDAPHALPEDGRRALLHLATLAEAAIAARAATRRAVEIARCSAEQATALARKDRVFRQAERMAMIGSWRFALADERLEWSDNVFRIHGLPVGTPPSVAGALDHYPPEARGRVAATLARTIETGEPFDLEEDFVTAAAQRRRVRAIGEVETVAGQPVAVVGVFQDVTEQYALEVALRRSADTDPLTGLANRAAFERTVERAMAHARETGAPLMLVLVDLDGFKAVNDSLGHLAGDDVLREVGRLLGAPWLGGTFAARLGGDEFALVVDQPRLVSDADALVRRLEEVLRVPAAAGGLAMIAAGTVGACAFDPGLTSVRDFVHCADTVLYAAKRARVGERRRGERRAG